MFSTQKLMHQFLQEHTLRPASFINNWKKTLVVAPHPQDEILGCGGAISLLRQNGNEVKVLYVTHGSLEDTQDPNMTKTLLKQSREQENTKTLTSVGLSEQDAVYLHIQGQLVPGKGEPGFEESIRLCLNELESFSPNTVLMPCRFHQYDDHYASWEVVQHAIDLLPYAVNRVEYMIWKEEREDQELVSTDTLNPWRLDIQPVMQQKAKAMAALRSQQHAPLHWVSHESPATDTFTAKTQPWETFLSQ